jgi:hypothetical protein
VGLMSRAKGKVGEREIAAILRELTGWDVQRLVRQHDRDCDLDVPGWAAEVKRHATANRGDIAQWWAQAVAQAQETDWLPVLFYRANRHPWRAVWPLAAHLALQSAPMWLSYGWTVKGSVEAWVAAARELVQARVVMPASLNRCSRPREAE